jgi:GntR family transcriptional regulator
VFRIDSKDPTPIYAQLEWAIRGAIATGQLRVGEQLPTVRQLAVDLRVNANTVAKVYAELERTGLLATRRGVGTFVTAQVGRPAGSPVERGKQVAALAERFLAGAAALGFSAGEAIDHLLTRLKGGEDGHGELEKRAGSGP